MPKTYSSIWIHTIWTTKERNPLLARNFRIPLCSRIRENAMQKGFIIDMINGVEDHLHGLIHLLPSQSVAEVMKQIKGASSHWINENGLVKIKFNWQQGYGALSVSPSQIDSIRNYIKNQEQHHKHWKLEDELQKFQFLDKKNP